MSQPSTSDVPAWELYKENAQPLKRGRDAGRLGLKLQEKSDGPGSAAAAAAAVDAKLQAFEVSVSEEALADSEDPLADWLKYLHWVREEFPSGTGAARAVEIMERCTRCFNHEPRYRNDERLIKVSRKREESTLLNVQFYCLVLLSLLIHSFNPLALKATLFIHGSGLDRVC